MTVRVGVIGTGWWATRAHLPALVADPDAEIAAIANRGAMNRARAAERFGIARTFPTAEAMLADVSLDAVVIAVPHQEHARLARLCLEHGLHVLLEKPMTIDPHDAFDLVRLAKRLERELIIGYPWHYDPQVVALRKVFTERGVGQIEALTCLFASIVRELYRGRPERYRDVLGYPGVAPRADTYSDPVIAGGGQGQTQVTHAAALLIWLTGLMPLEVQAMTADHELRVDLVDAMAIRFVGDALGTVTSTGSVLPGQDEMLEFRIFGTQGHVVADFIAGTTTIYRADGMVERLPTVPPEQRYPEAAPARNLVEVAAGNGSNGSPADVGATTVALVEAMYRSAGSGRRERLLTPGVAGDRPAPISPGRSNP